MNNKIAKIQICDNKFCFDLKDGDLIENDENATDFARD